MTIYAMFNFVEKLANLRTKLLAISKGKYTIKYIFIHEGVNGMNHEFLAKLNLKCRRRFALDLQIARWHKHMSQQVLAMLVGGTQSEISRWETGLVIPSLFKIMRLQHILQVDLLANVFDIYEKELTAIEEKEKLDFEKRKERLLKHQTV